MTESDKTDEIVELKTDETKAVVGGATAIQAGIAAGQAAKHFGASPAAGGAGPAGSHRMELEAARAMPEHGKVK